MPLPSPTVCNGRHYTWDGCRRPRLAASNSSSAQRAERPRTAWHMQRAEGGPDLASGGHSSGEVAAHALPACQKVVGGWVRGRLRRQGTCSGDFGGSSAPWW